MTSPSLVYDTAVLVQTVPDLKRPVQFLLDRYFPNIITSDTEFVAIDVEVGKRRMSPFVSPMVEGKLVEARRFQTNIFKPAYIKDKRAPDLRRPIRRMIGERLMGDMTGAAREAANLEYEMTDQLSMIHRRLEWMASQALQTGTVTVVGDGYPTTVVDFGRDSALTVALTGTSQWTVSNVVAGNASPTTNIEAWQRTILKKSGAKVKDLIFTTSSWLGFIADPQLKGAAFYPALAPYGNQINIGPSIGSGTDGSNGAVYKGKWGEYDLWYYNEWFVDDGSAGGTVDKEYPMLPDGVFLMTGPDLLGTRAFGTILDPAFNYTSLPFAPKTWIADDPAQRYLMMQSSPIVIPARVNASMAATVCPASYT